MSLNLFFKLLYGPSTKKRTFKKILVVKKDNLNEEFHDEDDDCDSVKIGQIKTLAYLKVSTSLLFQRDGHSIFIPLQQLLKTTSKYIWNL